MSVLTTGRHVASQERDPRGPALRLASLFDDGVFESLHPSGHAEVWTAAGRVNGVRTVAYCTDATTMGGALGSAGALRVVETIEVAVRERCPVIGVWHSGGARLAEGVESMNGVGQMFTAMTRASGLVPQISVVVGAAAGAAAYGPALTDVIIMAPAGRVFGRLRNIRMRPSETGYSQSRDSPWPLSPVRLLPAGTCTSLRPPPIRHCHHWSAYRRFIITPA
jgi:acetyl-CoA/propionyl-CoA carboxylase carboxyl transferase subunit